MVQLRALSGDTSDNIPGVPGFGVKTASKVLVAYGSIQTLLGSNLAGMGKVQAVNLRKHAKQVQLNLEVMALQDVQYTEVRPEPDLAKAAEMISQIDMKAEPIMIAFK
jgi:DNA polymerase-1